jgi:trans-2,3-dihydro-3-hydroxyanthranilate isomerase
MPTLAYHVVDVFAAGPYAGNPLAVVLGADDLPTESLQAIAREFNLSETAFPMASERGADYRVRIFTPVSELPFAGHPSVGTAWLLADLGRIPRGDVIQDCGAGLLPVTVTDAGAAVTGGAATVGEPIDPGPVLAAVGLDAASLSGLAPVRAAGAGLEWTYLPVTEAAVGQVAADWAVMERAVPGTGVVVLAWADGVAHVRALTSHGFEDPATGSAALGLGVYLVATGVLPDGTTDYRIEQGAEIGRPSTLYGTVTADGGTVSTVRVRGDVVPIAIGEITPPA